MSKISDLALSSHGRTLINFDNFEIWNLPSQFGHTTNPLAQDKHEKQLPHEAAQPRPSTSQGESRAELTKAGVGLC